MNYNTIEITEVPFDIEVKMKDHFGKEYEFMFTDEQADKFVCDQPGDYFVIDNRTEPQTRQYVRDFRLTHSL